RGPYLHWLMFAEATLVPVLMEHRQKVLSAGAQLPEVSARLEELVAVVDGRLEGRTFVATDAFTAADVSLASLLHVAHTLKLLETRPRLLEYVQRHTGRPASRRAVSG
ncbi:MAG TPA: glutathione S-transferase C-terminal domain-containing protein, partial [Aggregicoccus sp.]|nr:glutathione S-transferase C-terminal domain-containing protein [Aggregicoccus sp.]